MLESNPTNKHMLSKAQGLKFLLHLAHQSDEAVAPYYFRLIALLGMYDILDAALQHQSSQLIPCIQHALFKIGLTYSHILVLLKCVYCLILHACHYAIQTQGIPRKPDRTPKNALPSTVKKSYRCKPFMLLAPSLSVGPRRLILILMDLMVCNLT
jgi:hypothetical protein